MISGRLEESIGVNKSNPANAVSERIFSSGKKLVRHMSVNGRTGESWTFPIEHGKESMESAWDTAILKGGTAHSNSDSTSARMRLMDVFCGGGGLSYGVSEAVRAAGMRPVHMLAADVNPVALCVYRRNLNPRYHLSNNLWAAVTTSFLSDGHRNHKPRFSESPKLLIDLLRELVGQVDVLAGAPPCEGHSNSNNRTRRNDERNKYYILMPALAVALRAPSVIIENVPGIKQDNSGVLRHAMRLFQRYGYMIDDVVVDASKLGLAQTRSRHILVASLHRQPEIDAAIQELCRPETDLESVIGDLEGIESDDVFDSAGELAPENRARITHLFKSNSYDLEDSMRPPSHQSGNTYPSIYGRLRWNRPSGTITTGFNTPGRGRYIHPSRQRTITPHEAARIQGFPDTFEFLSLDGSPLTRSALGDIIGNATPPPLGYAAGIAALASLDF